MREFVTAVQAVEDSEDADTFGRDITVKIDGREVKFLPATEGQIAMMLASDIANIGSRISTNINFFFGLIRDERDSDWLRGRMFDRKDPFGPANISEIVDGLVEEWTGNPTQSSSDSTGSPPSSGDSSTESAPGEGSTHFSSDQTASAP